MIALPAVRILPERVCFHSDAPKTVAAEVAPAMAGSYLWHWDGGAVSAAGGRSANISWGEGAPQVWVGFTADGAALPRAAFREVTRCSKADEDTWCASHCCEHWHCACDKRSAELREGVLPSQSRRAGW